MTCHVKCQATADRDHMVYCAWGRNSDKAKYVTHDALPKGEGKTQGENHVRVLKSIGSDESVCLFLCNGCTVVRLIFTWNRTLSFLRNLENRDSRCSREGGWVLLSRMLSVKNLEFSPELKPSQPLPRTPKISAGNFVQRFRVFP